MELTSPSRRRESQGVELWRHVPDPDICLFQRACDGVLTAGLVTLAATAALATGDAALVVYPLSFWHYLLYWWAFRHRRVAAAVFRRDAVVTKALALTLFGAVYLASPWDWGSATVMAAGFALNAAAARALGVVRTYYGWELGEVPYQRLRTFPYAVVPHPMLLGNAAAYGGALLNPAFRHAWWPLPAAHLVLNLALLVMETTAKPAGGIAPARSYADPLAAVGAAAGGAVVGGVAAHAWLRPEAGLWAVVVGAAAAVHAWDLSGRYVMAGSGAGQAQTPPAKEMT